MISVTCRDSRILYNAYHLVKAFFPEEEVSGGTDEKQVSRISVVKDSRINAEDIRELYIILKDMTGKELPWGMLTGVRPIKLASAWLEEHRTEAKAAGSGLTHHFPEDPATAALTAEQEKEEFAKWFYEDRFVSRPKAEIAYNVALKEREILRQILPVSGTVFPGRSDPADTGYQAAMPTLDESFSLYIGIPFCPSVCSYCSFSSGSISAYEDRVDRYIDALSAEMKEKAAKYCSGASGHVYPTTVYIGGGTPTSLSAERLERLMEQADEAFHIKEGLLNGSIREYTVEAGRPDSITEEKLEVIKRFGTTRISVNPQSMQQKTLDLIGRKHTVEQAQEAFHMARQMGFDNINMDLIAGLPGETNEDMKNTLDRIKALDPDSLTVHSLAVKRASAIGIAIRTGKETKAGEAPDIADMIEDARRAAASMGMEPYYLYRQKSIAGNFENTGYAKPGKEGLYNILIMEEVQSIIACGAGASTKMVTVSPVPNPERGGKDTLIVRTENVKNIDGYIKRILEGDNRG